MTAYYSCNWDCLRPADARSSQEVPDPSEGTGPVSAQDSDVMEFDLIIVGGGPVGLSLAAAMNRFVPGCRICICERRAFEVPKDARASALSAGVTTIFKTLGVWDGMAAEASPIDRMKITDSGEGDISRPLFLNFEGEVHPGQPFAYMVPNRATIAGLMKAVADVVTIKAPAEVVNWSAGLGHAELSLSDGQVLRAPLIVAADGARSWLRQQAGIGTRGHDYRQSGLVTTIAHSRDHENTAYEHFRPAGPFASLPLPGQRSSLVWSEATERANELAAMPKPELAHEIEAVMGHQLGEVEIVDDVQAFPLRLQIANSFVGPRLALIGDAAHVVHPIAGQGLNLGLKGVAALAETLTDAMRLGLDIGSPDVLNRYEQWRRGDTLLMAAVMDGLNRLFSNDIAPVRALRDFGLGLVDRSGPLKTLMIRQAAAAGVMEPKLLRGQSL
jgi:2-octaprenyl-6-methoxyphenol hydroxylase